MKNKFYITTPVYYVNARPHIGHAYTTVAADALARAHREQGAEAYFLTGTDEHGLKIEKKAREAGKEPQKFADEMAGEFKSLWEQLGIQYDSFIRTTDDRHKKAVQKVLQTLFDQGVIYKGEYEGFYCVGCEQFKNESDLVEGKCADHDTICEKVKEESYLLKMAEKQEQLMEEIKSDKFRIRPEKYKKEILSFLEKGKLNDVSISRKNVKWGIPLPFDTGHTTYVWFDAFLSYLTGIGWDGEIPLSPPLKKGEAIPLSLVKGELERDFENFWPPEVQLIGKDILRVHATIWPVMLMHLGIELPPMIYVHGHLLSGGRKMSKTIGNVISIDEMIEKFGAEATRYLLLSSGTFGADVDVTMEHLTEKYNADLANGLGNFVSRVVKLLGNQGNWGDWGKRESLENWGRFFENLELDKALEEIWKIVREDDKFVEMNKPWELKGNMGDEGDKEKFQSVMGKLLSDLYLISELLIPFMPETSEKIKKAIESKEAASLFPRIKIQ